MLAHDGRRDAPRIQPQAESKVIRLFGRADAPGGVEHVVEIRPAERALFGHVVDIGEGETAQLRRDGFPRLLRDIINDADSARQVTHYLIDGGSRRIAFLGGSNQMKQTADRKHGYLEALRERNIPIRKELVKCHDASINSGLSDTLELLSLPKPPDAIIASHGMLAIAAYQTIVSQNLRIPDDVAIVGYMSDWVSDMTTPRMSFVKQNLREIGSKAFKLLHDQMNGDILVRRMVVKARLEIRDSTRKIN